MFAVEGGGQFVLDGRGVVVKGAAGAEVLDVGEVLGGGGRDDVVARGDGALDGVAADARGAAPDEERFARRLWVQRGVLQVQIILAEEADYGRGEAQWDDGRLLVADRAGDRRRHVGGDHGVVLESG